MKSKLYFGDVVHNRFTPHRHSFKYKMFMLYIDLDELPTLFDGFLLWSKDKSNIASFRSKNYLFDKNNDIKSAVRLEIKKQLNFEHLGPVRMLTHLSYFGYCFNPVSFYYCFDESDNHVEFIVAQINNTPWNERYCYVLDNRLLANKKSKQARQTNSVKRDFDKSFHVSPFLPMNMQYFWNFSSPQEKLTVYMKNTQNTEKVFDVALKLSSKPINSVNLAKALIKFPLMTWQVAFGIYWQSLVLWLKRTPFYSHPNESDT